MNTSFRNTNFYPLKRLCDNIFLRRQVIIDKLEQFTEVVNPISNMSVLKCQGSSLYSRFVYVPISSDTKRKLIQKNETRRNSSIKPGSKKVDVRFFFSTDLSEPSDLLLPNGRKVLQREAMFPKRVYELRDTYPSLHRDGLLLGVDVEHLVHEREVDHPSAGERDPIGGQAGAEGPELAALLVRGGERALEGRERVRLEQDAGVDLVRAAPVGDGVEVLRQRRVPEWHGLLVQRVGGEREGVVGRGAAAEKKQRVARVLAELCVRGDRGGGGGEGAEEGEVVVVAVGDAAAATAAEEAGEEEVTHRGVRAARRGGSERRSRWRSGGGGVRWGWAAPAAATAADRDGA